MMKMRNVASGVKIIHYKKGKKDLINHAKLSKSDWKKRRLIKVEKSSINL